MVRALGQHCGSTALALSMHTHQVAIAAWRWRHEGGADGAVPPANSPPRSSIMATSGGSDWLAGSGHAEKMMAAIAITGRKVFASGSPAGDLFTTMAIYDDPESGPHRAAFRDSLRHAAARDHGQLANARDVSRDRLTTRAGRRLRAGPPPIAAASPRGAVGSRCGTSSLRSRCPYLRGLRRRGRGGARARPARGGEPPPRRGHAAARRRHGHRARRRADGAPPDDRRRRLRPPRARDDQRGDDRAHRRRPGGDPDRRARDGGRRRRRLLPGRRASSGCSATFRAPATTRSAPTPSTCTRGGWPSAWTSTSSPMHRNGERRRRT